MCLYVDNWVISNKAYILWRSNMDYKKQEIREHLEDFLEEAIKYDRDYLINNDNQEVHQQAFNNDYYIIGTYRAVQWLGDEVFNVINFIKEYEMDNFGEVYTDFSSAEAVVNMYTYIIGEQLCSYGLCEYVSEEVA